ncbi:MAG: NAD(P)-binding protein [Pseudomonadales bacterium]|nr:NAD(P)-binding protein [Pseudomonadales bacterium]
MTKPSVAIIGAGLTGLTAAHRLIQAGIECTIFDKSRGVGGRMATRRAEYQGATLRFDHGTSYLTHAQASGIADVMTPASTAGPNQDQSLRHLCEAAELTPWSLSSFGQTANLMSASGINAVGKALAVSLDINLDASIVRADRDASGNRWQLRTQDALLPETFDLLITATPPVQAANILGPYQGPIMPTLTNIRPRACWTLMLGTQRPASESAMNSQGEVIHRIIPEHSKNRPQPSGLRTYTIQAGREWSQEHAQTDADSVAQAMLRQLKKLGWDSVGIEHQQIHRWLYAGVVNPADVPCLTDSGQGLICAGDWCLGNDIDSALASGNAAALQTLKILG